MPRTTSTLVQGIIETDESVSLTPFIEAASVLVTECCAGLSDYTYTDDSLQQIETWLAAHIYTVRDPRSFQETVASLQNTFQTKVDLGLATSHYGQMAMLLDFKGGLSRWNGRMRGAMRNENKSTAVSLTWVGKEEDNDTE